MRLNIAGDLHFWERVGAALIATGAARLRCGML
jgi:hypothetical protein